MVKCPAGAEAARGELIDVENLRVSINPYFLGVNGTRDDLAGQYP